MLQKIILRRLYTSFILRAPVKLAFTSHDEKSSANKQPIVIMDGLFGSKNNWNSIGDSLNKRTRRRVIAIDARNHGDSPRSSQFTYQSMAEDILALLHDLGYEKAIFIGCSMGGAAMMFTALNYPSIVEKLIVIDMSPIKISPILPQMNELLNYMLLSDFSGMKSLDEARKMVDKYLARLVNSVSNRKYILANIIEEQPGVYKWKINIPVIAKNFQNHLANFPRLIADNKNFDGPTLFIKGSKSAYIKDEDHDEIGKVFTKLRIEKIKGAGHLVYADKPAEFLKVSTEFINHE